MNSKQLLSHSLTLAYYDRVQLLNDIAKSLGFHYPVLIDENDIKSEINARMQSNDWQGHEPTELQISNACRDFSEDYQTAAQIQSMICDIASMIERDCK